MEWIVGGIVCIVLVAGLGWGRIRRVRIQAGNRSLEIDGGNPDNTGMELNQMTTNKFTVISHGQQGGTTVGQINNYGRQDRELTGKLQGELLSAVAAKGEVTVATTSQDAESQRFATKIKAYLTEHGVNVANSLATRIYASQALAEFEGDVNVVESGNGIDVIIKQQE